MLKQKSCKILLLIGSFVQIALAHQELSYRYPLIPKPAELIPAEGFFTINSSTMISLHPLNMQTKDLAMFIVDFLAIPLGNLQYNSTTLLPQKNIMSIEINQTSTMPPEGYSLSITQDAIRIKASTTKGAFWAFQTLRQLMPAQVERHAQLSGGFLEVPCVTITDAPRFAYRGLHLDVARHMFPVAFIKKYIDLMSTYKLNTFHWHLTDDQGWRIEIKKYPKLQEIAAYRDQTLMGHGKALPKKFDGKPYGGYYTQQEIKEIVEYARQRQITIIPELELPGHCMAALAAYPHLGCTGGPYKTATHWGIFEDVYCAGNERAFTFLQDVLTEIIELFPSSYIHIGGDEVRKNCWRNCLKCQERIKVEGLKDEYALQSYFVGRIEKFLNEKGRQIIGWDEILEGGLAPNATVMSWTGIEGGIEAARANHNVIMTPFQYLYFDHYQNNSLYEPLAIGGYLALQKVYAYEPIPTELHEEESKHILGAQANVWTEYIPTPEQVEYMLCPRMMALAEINWTQAQQKDYQDFCKRLKNNLTHVKSMHVGYADDYENFPDEKWSH